MPPTTLVKGKPWAEAPFGGKQAEQYLLKRKSFGQLFFEKTYLWALDFIISTA